MRKKISDMVNSDQGLEVVGTAKNGNEAVKETILLKPDVVTLDLAMPKLDGLSALGYIMSELPTPVIIVSAYSKPGAPETFTALEYGAVDFISKPVGTISMNIDDIKQELILKIKIAAKVDMSKIKLKLASKDKKKIPQAKASTKFNKIVVIGASTGGPRALSELIPKLPANLPAAVIVVQHMPPDFTAAFSARLDMDSLLRVKEAAEGDVIEAGKVLVVPGDYHLELCEKGNKIVVALNKKPKVCNIRPSINVTMKSAAALYGDKVIGVILTGMGEDGVDGLAEIKRLGGKTIAEDKSTAIIYGMPAVAAKRGVADQILPLYSIADEIVKLVNNGK
ncbi:MAG: chemotaxis response regulator protein-glutamate methylesterase [Candidatus Margulisbacteria bacterium]|nr:chemotaxis response regulator protein-glutamate methylesterase [Candidatus Margulisiibacteriota bacterium]